VGPRTGLITMAKRKISSLSRESKPDHSYRLARSLVAIPIELSRLLCIRTIKAKIK